MMHPSQTPGLVACCICGSRTPSDRMVEGMCTDCVSSTIDITAGIESNLDIEMCRTCANSGVYRWYRNPQWAVYEPESAELLSLCVRRIRGLKGLSVVDASWVWTEPHARRLKVKLTVAREVLSGTRLQQSILVEFTVCTRNCDRCNKAATKDTWQAKVQLRQRAEHPKTLLAMEQAHAHQYPFTHAHLWCAELLLCCKLCCKSIARLSCCRSSGATAWRGVR